MPNTYFVSRAGADAEFAGWLAQELEADGHKAILQQKDFGHQSFMNAMHEALTSGARVIALYSPNWFLSDYCLAEGQTPLGADPLNKNQKLIPLRIGDCAPSGIFQNIAYTDLVPLLKTDDPNRAGRIRYEVWVALKLANRTLAASPFGAPTVNKTMRETADKFMAIREFEIYMSQSSYAFSESETAMIMALKEKLLRGALE